MVPSGPSSDKNSKFSHLHRFLNALRQPDDRRDGDHQSLSSYIEAERRDLDGEAFALLDTELHLRITALAKRLAPNRFTQATPWLAVSVSGPLVTFSSVRCMHAILARLLTTHVGGQLRLLLCYTRLGFHRRHVDGHLLCRAMLCQLQYFL
jgi:hypothetical protein